MDANRRNRGRDEIGGEMSIRLRTVNGTRVALCAYETDKEPGDLYLDDADHYALAAKFRRDWQGQKNNFAYPEEWAAMDTQKLRDAATRTDLTPQAGEASDDEQH
jgi:hypothetical protein